ncbi:MAG TPA: class I SAM-dependent methyltransferase [Micromonosporaceae bacterium]|nr:class I SAM-dependent methyltransferase [Micromonosporaceae bacterium]
MSDAQQRPAAQPPLTSRDFDTTFAAVSGSRLLPALWWQAYGDEYPAELRTFSLTTWSLLKEVRDRLAVRPGSRLLDLGCGAGGPGLWLAGQAVAELVGLDFSLVALGSAARRAPAFLPAGRAHFVAATFLATGLADASVDAAVSFDAFIFCRDKAAGFRELHRVLRPGAQFAFTLAEVIDPADATDLRLADHRPLVEAAGLHILHYAETPSWREPQRRTYQLWLEHAGDLRADLGEEAAAVLLDEAGRVGAQLDNVRRMLLLGARGEAAG